MVAKSMQERSDVRSGHGCGHIELLHDLKNEVIARTVFLDGTPDGAGRTFEYDRLAALRSEKDKTRLGTH
jgi:hypothetical protein